jgi:Pyruvate/2-oxoacid:ferredoxin oxidoreductase delta subunit
MKRGRGSKNRGFRQNRFVSENELCICPQCGHTSPHVRGTPCRNFLCPVCHISLIRYEKDLITEKPAKNNLKAKKMDYPKVNPELCTGCGNCMEVCPTQAISFVDGKAFINEDECARCRACENECPVGAIS